MNTSQSPRVKVEDYYHDLVPIFIERIEKSGYKKVCLCGFSELMKWLSRLLEDLNYEVSLADTRSEFVNYECGTQIVNSIYELSFNETVIVISEDEPAIIKNHLNKIYKCSLNKTPVIYDSNRFYSPLRQDLPYSEIIKKAEQRAKSMISDEQLFDLIQLIKLTREVPGSVVEYGSLHGGSGAVLAEALNYFGSKNLYLFDTFAGIPSSSYGLDYRWEKAFSNNSFSQVKNAFLDLKNVQVIRGNIKDTHKSVEGPFSFAYIASDTLESGEYLMEYVWPRLSRGGIVHTCDYGSYPNCLPLTMFLDEFENNNKDVISFRTSKAGIYFVKN